jgi:hypothetical protein
MESFSPYAFPATHGGSTQIPFVQTTVGRGKNSGINDLTGRTVYGRTTVMPSLTNLRTINQDLYIASGTAGVGEEVERFFQSEAHTKSPYLLYPKDKLFISLSKWRSAFVSQSYLGVDHEYASRGQPTPLGYDRGDFLDAYLYQSCSHDVGLKEGILTITLYGSLIKEGKEYHDTLNSYLDTDQVHEAIGMDPIVDEFDVFYTSELTGSYLDRYITGSFYSTTNPRSLVFSNINPDDYRSRLPNGQPGTSFDHSAFSKRFVTKSTVANNPRFVQLSSIEERLWDTFTPDIVRWIETGGGSVSTPDATLSALNAINVGSPLNDFNKALLGFPFEPLFSNIERVTNEKIKFMQGGSATYRKLDGRNFYVALNGYYGAVTEVLVVDSNGPSSSTGLSKDDVLKVIFGFGRYNSCRDASEWTVGAHSPSWAGSTRAPGLLWGSGATRIGVEIRGWRYGICNALPQFTKAIFNRNHYGYVRDMLEQRCDTKFSTDGANQSIGNSPVNVRFVNERGQTVRPEQTFSSNLSLEVTSSLPYFDGDVRNRENPIALAFANQTIVVV